MLFLIMVMAMTVFVLGSAGLLIGLGALTVTIAAAGRGRRRLVAIVPAGTAAGIILYVRAGGPVLLGAWLIAALFALALSGSAELGAHPEEAEELVGHETPHPT